MAKETNISLPVIRRLPRYYRFLYDLKEKGITRISSRELSQKMRLTASQIRQDLNCFGGFGQQGYGYMVDQLYDEIGRILGMDRLTKAILVGVGNLGTAVGNHIDFKSRGFNLIGLFDDNPDLVGDTRADMTIRSTDEIEEFCRREQPEMAVLCIPKEAAPRLVEVLVNCGVKGFWNFSHYDILHDHPEVIVENVHMGDTLMTLSYHMVQEEE
ncbi:MAG: redox-sensing transcriptional repressor Rex [Clostridia bacterium]|nr:redox-sensing transcriptional repressor Rex [Clostridia bacterium]